MKRWCIVNIGHRYFDSRQAHTVEGFWGALSRVAPHSELELLKNHILRKEDEEHDVPDYVIDIYGHTLDLILQKATVAFVMLVRKLWSLFYKIFGRDHEVVQQVNVPVLICTQWVRLYILARWETTLQLERSC